MPCDRKCYSRNAACVQPSLAAGHVLVGAFRVTEGVLVREQYVRAKDWVQQMREEKLDEIKNELEEPVEDDPDDLGEDLVLKEI